MSQCTCQDAHGASEAHIRDFSTVGFHVESSPPSIAAHEGVLALKLSACLSASYDPGTNKVCFTMPVYGKYCVTPPVHIPVGGQLKACAETCGSFIPAGLKATIYLNGSPAFTVTLFGIC